jgi:hypothetical protein
MASPDPSSCCPPPLPTGAAPADRLTLAGGLGLAVVFLSLSMAFLKDGVLVRGDGIWYVALAERLARGEVSPGHAWSRLGYVALIAGSLRVGLGLGGVVAVQMVIAAAAAVALFDLGRRLAGARAGLLSVALFAANPDVVRWHAYILTDSLYISVVVLATWLTFRAAERGRLWYLAASAVLLASILVRPNGWCLVAVAPCYWLARSALSPRARLAAVAGVLFIFVAGFAVLLEALPRLRGATTLEELLRRGEVIAGYPEGRLVMPADPVPEPGRVPGATGYVLRHPGACLRLAAVRVFTELAHSRPFYSRRHNTLILLFLPPLYALAIVGLLRTWWTPLAPLLLAVIVAHLLVQAANYADWDGRFLLYVFPLIGVFSSAGFAAACRWLRGAARPSG